MITAHDVLARGTWKGEPADTVVLEFDDRHRRRVTMEGVGGLTFLLDLPETVALRSGDAIKLQDGRLVEVMGAPEALIEITGKSPEHLLQLAWQLGNRHLPVQIAGQKLRIRQDHVIVAMVQGLGGKTRSIEAAFDPEGGAYLAAQAHGHDHGHHHGHDHGHHHHDHGHDHAHKHDHTHDHKHEHAHHDHHDGCGCGHDHHDHGTPGHKHKHD